MIPLLFYGTIAKRQRSVSCMDTPPAVRGLGKVVEKHKMISWYHFWR